jgi:oxygen-dependent protoporphyrinogen oxidase
MTAAIVGGGISGLVAAYELVKAGERPFLIESGQLGGMISSAELDGFTLEHGPNVLVERPDLKQLLSELGLASQAAYPSVNPYGQYVWYRGSAVKVPAGLLEFIRSPLFELSAKLLLPLKAIIPGVLSTGPDNDRSVADFFSPLIGERGVNHLLDPVLKGIYGGDVTRLSARSLFSGLWSVAENSASLLGYMRARKSGGKPPILVMRGGMRGIADALWREIGPHVELITSQAQRINPADGNRFKISLVGGRQIESDGVIVTVAGPRLAPLVPGLSEDLADALINVRYATLAVAHLHVPRSEPLIPAAFGVLFPGGMPEDLLGVMFNSLIFPHVAPPDKHVLTVVLGGAQAGAKVFDEAKLRSRIPELLKELLNISNAKWISMRQWPAAIPQLEVGHHRLVSKLDQCEHDFPGIVFSGVDRGGVGVSDRIRLAKEAVKRFRRLRVETVV